MGVRRFRLIRGSAKCARSPAVAQRVQQQGEGGRRLTTTRVVNMIAGKRRTPIRENADQLTPGKVFLNLRLWQVRET
jgi:hypothetical protein